MPRKCYFHAGMEAHSQRVAVKAVLCSFHAVVSAFHHGSDADVACDDTA